MLTCKVTYELIGGKTLELSAINIIMGFNQTKLFIFNIMITWSNKYIKNYEQSC